MRLPKFVAGSPPRYSLAPSRMMFMWLSQSIILPLYSVSFLSLTATSPFILRMRRFNGFLDGSNRLPCRGSPAETIKTLCQTDALGLLEYCSSLALVIFSCKHLLVMLFLPEIGLELSASYASGHLSSSAPLVRASWHSCQR